MGVLAGCWAGWDAGEAPASCLSLCPKPGSPVYSSKCQDCVCTDKVDNNTLLNVIACSHVPCNTSCSPVSGHPPPSACPFPSSQTSPQAHVCIVTLSFLLSTPTCPCPYVSILTPAQPGASSRWGVSAALQALCGVGYGLGVQLQWCVYVRRASNSWRPPGSAVRSVNRRTVLSNGPTTSTSS